LAIELAAARLRVLSPQQVVDRLNDRYGLLSSGSRAALPRQRSLQALVDWSFERCSRSERTMWARSSVFAGAFDLDAAEQVCSGDGLAATAVLDAVAGLLDKSVLVRDEDGGQVRYRMLESIREYGRIRLNEAGEPDKWRRRHLAYCESLSGQAADEWFGPNEPEWRRRMRAALPDLRAALEFCLASTSETNAGLRLAGELWYGWRALGMVGEGRRWLDRLLQAAAEGNRTRAQALLADGALAIFQDDAVSARPRLDEAGVLGRELDDDSVLAYVALFSGQVAMSEGDMPRALGVLESALSAHRRAGDALGTAMTLFRLSLTHSALGESGRAVEVAEAHLALADEYGSEWSGALAHWALGVARWEGGDVAAVDRHATEVIEGAWAHDDAIGTGRGLELLAWAAAASDRPERAARLLGAIDGIRRTVGGHSFGYPHLAHYNDACAASALTALGQEKFDACYSSGSALSLSDSVAFAVGGRPVPVAPAPSEEPAGRLTPREQEVAELLGEGMTNQQIADRLVISRRTAETHVDHILTKLGFTSRAQVAAWVTEHRLG
jgi:DNA-binding CsgD family transcriptional regulator